MEEDLRVRRARRDDLARVWALLGREMPPTRADRKRFRRLVGTLREDLYVAERGAEAALLGLALVVYVRGLGPPTAIVRRLEGASPSVAALLLDRAVVRARARGCTSLELLSPTGRPAPAGPPWTVGAQTLVRAVAP